MPRIFCDSFNAYLLLFILVRFKVTVKQVKKNSAACFATLLQNELNSNDVALFTIRKSKPFNFVALGCETPNTAIFNSCCRNAQNKLDVFSCPFYCTLNNKSPSLHKKAKPWRILVVEVKWRHRTNSLLGPWEQNLLLSSSRMEDKPPPLFRKYVMWKIE